MECLTLEDVRLVISGLPGLNVASCETDYVERAVIPHLWLWDLQDGLPRSQGCGGRRGLTGSMTCRNEEDKNTSRISLGYFRDLLHDTRLCGSRTLGYWRRRRDEKEEERIK